MSEEKTYFQEIQYGFEWGALSVERACSDVKKGWVYLTLSTPKCNRTNNKQFDIYVTRTGKIRIFSGGKELM